MDWSVVGAEDEIRTKLMQGYSPQQLVGEGYKKSTVYKISGLLKAQVLPVSRPDWVVENCRISEGRFLPGQSAPVGFTLRNTSPLDMYLVRIGVQAEWMQGTWIAQEVKDLLKSGAQRWFSLMLPIPSDVAMGEYEVSIGVEGQYLPSNQYQSPQTQWSEPLILSVKNPLRGVSIFLSHSTRDLALVRDLEKRLDNEGLEVRIAEDVSEPGVLLDEKFRQMIRESTILLALLTEEGARSDWVVKEVNYALEMGKPAILLKEESANIETKVEWVNFSRYDPPEAILSKIMSAISAVQSRTAINPFGAIIGLAILGLIVGSLSSTSKG